MREIEKFCYNKLGQLFVEGARQCYWDREDQNLAHYHDWNHALDVAERVQDMLEEPYKGAFSLEQQTAMLQAALGHDMRHTNTTPTDEELSVEWLKGMLGTRTKLAQSLIMATAYHLKPLPAYPDPVHKEMASIIVDADLQGLALVDYKAFVKQNNDIAHEVMAHKACTEGELFEGRLAFIQFAQVAATKHCLFRTSHALTLHQDIALANLKQYEDDLKAAQCPFLPE